MGAWEDSISEMLMQPATASRLLDFLRCFCVARVLCSILQVKTHFLKPCRRTVEAVSPHLCWGQIWISTHELCSQPGHEVLQIQPTL